MHPHLGVWCVIATFAPLYAAPLGPPGPQLFVLSPGPARHDEIGQEMTNVSAEWLDTYFQDTTADAEFVQAATSCLLDMELADVRRLRNPDRIAAAFTPIVLEVLAAQGASVSWLDPLVSLLDAIWDDWKLKNHRDAPAALMTAMAPLFERLGTPRAAASTAPPELAAMQAQMDSIQQQIAGFAAMQPPQDRAAGADPRGRPDLFGEGAGAGVGLGAVELGRAAASVQQAYGGPPPGLPGRAPGPAMQHGATYAAGQPPSLGGHAWYPQQPPHQGYAHQPPYQGGPPHYQYAVCAPHVMYQPTELKAAAGFMARDQLARQVSNAPEQIIHDFEMRLTREIGLGRDGHVPAPKIYFEQRCPIVGKPDTVRMLETLSHIYTDLSSGQPAVARARCALAMQALEQATIDGDWQVAWELTSLPQPAFMLHSRQTGSVPADGHMVQGSLVNPDRMGSVVAYRGGLAAVTRAKAPVQPLNHKK